MGSYCLMGTLNFQFGIMKKFRRWISGDGGTTMFNVNVLNAIELYT